MTNQQDRWSNQGIPLGQPFKYVFPKSSLPDHNSLTISRQNPPVLPPPATLEAGGQPFSPFPNLPALGNRGNASSGHVFTIPSISSNDDRRPSGGPPGSSQGSSAPQGSTPASAPHLPHVQGFALLPQNPPPRSANSIYNITNRDPQQQGEKDIKQEQHPEHPQHQQQQQPQLSSLSYGPLPQQSYQTPSQLAPQGLKQPQSGQLQQQGLGPHDPQRPSLTPLVPSAQVQQSHQALGPAAQAPPGGAPLPPGVMNRSSTSSAYRPLNVKDALSYLDQVKIQFYNQADVYNNFLDIMKDFKLQSIDTPGVIDRVSNLFRGHPNLIQGFNTFLPPGYRIECSLDPSDPNPIRVTTPTGTTTRPNVGLAPQQQQQQQQWSAEQMLPHQLQQFPADQQAQPGAGGQVEFNHAISYVNKIKTRFANQPDIYKQFLEILQTYQREQKPIGEVYEQVTQLFSSSPDLLNDFKQFLPDSGNQPLLQQQRGHDGSALLGQGAQPHLHHGDKPTYFAGNNGSQLPPLGNFQPAAGGAMINGEQQFRSSYDLPPQDVGMQGGAMMQEELRRRSELQAYENNYNEEAQYSSVRGGLQPAPNKLKHGTPGAQTIVTKNGARVNPTLVPGVPEPVPPTATVRQSSLLEELGFFDKVKKAIGNKQTYNEFLKFLNLYSQDIIDKATLIERVELFLGDTHQDLLNWFKQFVGYKEETLHIEDITFKKHQIELSLCKAYGPSYRQLPKVETYMPCSGRDEMCWEVLNDEWVGHPTWASEDSGFISHRKNQYEEILFKIEEERLEFDYHIEANLRTIQTLETIANRIANMTAEQKANFKLPPGLGHTSQTIYKKVIRKIYDKDRGFEVIDALHENPAIAVPVVLKRLKQKDEEWKRAQREWNKVWREMEQKVFYKSLDHLGLTFKQADKKLLTAKQLVSEISTVKVEQQNKRVHPLTPKAQEQLHYEFKDFDVVYDVIKLAEFYIFHSSNYSTGDRDKLGAFFKYFVGLFFGIPQEIIEKALAERSKEEREKAPEAKSVEENGNIADQNGSSDSAASKKRNRDPDLLRDVLKKQSKTRKEEKDASLASESEEPDLLSEIEKSGELWIRTASSSFSLDDMSKEHKRDKFNFFGNTTIYVFFRHFRTLYERLEEVKSMNDEVAKEIRSRTIPKFAKDLNLVSHQLEELGVQFDGSKDCYKQLLSLTERLLEGDIEHQWFEESLRQGYCNKAYKCYTIDKVVQALVKHMHTMITDSKTSEMIVLFEQDRNTPSSTVKDQILYRIQVRSLTSNEENMFKIVVNEPDHSVMIEFVGLDDLTINDHENAEESYNYYVTSYVMSHPTEGVPASKINMPFHKGFIDAVDEEQCEGKASSDLRVSICENSYRLFFQPGAHDCFISNLVLQKQKESGPSKEEKLSTLQGILDDEDFGWKANSESGDIEKRVLDFNTLLEKGAGEYKALRKQDDDVEMKDADETTERLEAQDETQDAGQETSDGNQKPTETQDEPKHAKNDGVDGNKVNPDTTVDADSTIFQDQNDTTIQQDANDDGNEDDADQGGDKNGLANSAIPEGSESH